VVTNIAVTRDRQISTTDQLNDYFAHCGRIVAIRTAEKASDPDVLEALVTFSDKSSACKALELNNSAFGERIIGVHCALDVDISHLVNIPPITFTERIQENVTAIKETVLDTYSNLPEVAAIKESVVNSLPEVKEAVVDKASAAYESVKDSLYSAYETVANYVGGGEKQEVPPQAVFGKPAS